MADSPRYKEPLNVGPMAQGGYDEDGNWVNTADWDAQRFSDDVGKVNQAGQDAVTALGPNASQAEISEAKEKAENDARSANGLTNNGTVAVNPGSADVGGGPGMGEYYRQQALERMRSYDADYDANGAAMARNIGAMKEDRGEQAAENQFMLRREAEGRETQMDALGMARDAAMGGDVSASKYQTLGAMDSAMGTQASQAGAAKGLSALGAAQGGAGLGMNAGNLAIQGGMGRSKEMQDNIGMYGSQASGVRGGDLARLQEGDSNSIFNSNLNNSWKTGNAGIAAKRGALGNEQEKMRGAWYDASTEPGKKQAQNDQVMQGMQHGQNAGEAAARLAGARAEAERNQKIGTGIGAGVGGAIGSFGGPIGTAIGSQAGGMAGSDLTTRKW